MSKVLVFSFDPVAARGGLSDLRHVLETDNRQGIDVLDAEGYLRPEVVRDVALRSNSAGCLQVLHLDAWGTPQRQEEWQRVRVRGLASTLSEPLVTVEDGLSYLRVNAGSCVLGWRS